MNKGLTSAVAFIFGAAVSAVVTWKITKDHYARIADEEIADVVNRFTQKYGKREDDEKKDEKPVTQVNGELEAYGKLVHDCGYSQYEEEGEADEEKFEIISPDEFGTIDYETVYLSYYADRILADEVDDVVEIDDTVGAYSLTRFGEYEDEIIHVRNHQRRTDYEVTIDNREFLTDIKGTAADE